MQDIKNEVVVTIEKMPKDSCQNMHIMLLVVVDWIKKY